MYRELIDYLRNKECFIEAEARPSRMRNFINDYNASYGENLSIDDEGIILLQDDANKWGLELRLYIRNCPPQNIMDLGFAINTDYRIEFSYRLNNKDIVNYLFSHGYRIGIN